MYRLFLGDLAIAEDDNETTEITNPNIDDQGREGSQAAKTKEATETEIKSSAFSDNSPQTLQIDEDEKNVEEEKAAPNSESTSEKQVEKLNPTVEMKKEEDTHGSGSVVSNPQPGMGIPYVFLS